MNSSILNILKTLLKQEKGARLGRKKGFLPIEEVLTESELNHHVHIVGASGFGKTVFLSHLIKSQINEGKGLMLIDLKGDIETIQMLSEFVKNAGRENDLEIFSLADQSATARYNILGDGSANQLRDRIMASLNWSEEYYKNQSSSYLLRLMIGLCWLRDNENLQLNIGTVLKCCSSLDSIESFGLKIPRDFEFERESLSYCLDFLNNPDNFKSLQGLRSQLESIVYSDFGTKVVFEGDGINIFESVQNSKIRFFFLDSRRYGETAKVLGRFLLQDLKFASAKVDAEILKENRKPFSVIVDEFSDFAQEDFIAFLDRARSSKCLSS